MNRLSRWITKLSVVALLVGIASVSIRGQWAPKVGEWATYGGDLSSTRYSPLDQINASNFNKLQLAFRIKTDNLGPRPLRRPPPPRLRRMNKRQRRLR